MTTRRRYWLALHPDIRKPIGGAKQMHRFAEALMCCGRQATLIQEQAEFHPGWFQSQVKTISLADWRQLRDLNPRTDVVVLPETFLPALPTYRPGLPKLIFNQNGAYSFGLGDGDGFPDTAEAVLNLYSHCDLAHVLCVSEHDQQLLERGFNLGPQRVSRLINAVETDVFRPGGSKKPAWSHSCRARTVAMRQSLPLYCIHNPGLLVGPWSQSKACPRPMSPNGCREHRVPRLRPSRGLRPPL